MRRSAAVALALLTLAAAAAAKTWILASAATATATATVPATPTHAEQITVHLVPHTHDDAGWQVSVDEYQLSTVDTILDNVLLPAELAGKDRRSHWARAQQLLEMAGLHGFGDKLPRELSGGMQQRASLCRALLLDPPLLLMDEPFGALDAMTRDDMALELLRIWGENDLERSQRKTVLFVTHSIAEAVFLSDRVVVMSPRPGRIAADLRIDLPRPRTVELRASEAFGQLSLEIFRMLTGRPVAGSVS